MKYASFRFVLCRNTDLVRCALEGLAGGSAAGCRVRTVGGAGFIACSVSTSPSWLTSAASRATFALNSAAYRFRFPVIFSRHRVRP